MNKETYIRAILETNFAGFKDEIIEHCVKRIAAYRPSETVKDTGDCICKNCNNYHPYDNYPLGRCNLYDGWNFCNNDYCSNWDNGEENNG